MISRDYLINFLDTVGLGYKLDNNICSIKINNEILDIIVINDNEFPYKINDDNYTLPQLCFMLFDKLRRKDSNVQVLHNILNTIGVICDFKYISRINMITSAKGFRIYVNKDYSFIDMDTNVEYETLTELVDIFIIGR